MIELPTIEHAPGLLRRAEAGAVTSQRRTVKAVIRQKGELWLLHAPQLNVFKFAGGGQKCGESDEATLVRELREETGAELLRVGPPLLCISELSPAREAEAEIFRMDSVYYPCEVLHSQYSTQLEAYEAALGLTLKLVSPQEAAATNHQALTYEDAPRWLRREIEVLRALS